MAALHISEEEILSLVDQIYAAALDPNGWDAVVASLNRSIPMAGIGLSGMHGGDNPSYLFIQNGYDPDTVEEFVASHTENNPWRDILPKIPTGTIFDPYASAYSHDFLKSDLAAFMQRRDMDAGVAAVVSNEPGQTFHLSVDFSPTVTKDVQSAAARVANVLAPHMARSFNILHRTAVGRAEADMLAGLIDGLVVPAILVDGNMKIRSLNSASDKLFEDRRGFSRNMLDILTLADSEAQDTLQQAVQATINMELSQVRAATVPFRVPGRKDIGRISVVPIAADSSLSHNGLTQFFLVPERLALLIISSGSVREEVMKEQLRRRYGLTPAQGRLACALCQGKSLDDYAEQNGIRTVTARNHLQAIFEKTDTHRQNQLVAMLLETTASW